MNISPRGQRTGAGARGFFARQKNGRHLRQPDETRAADPGALFEQRRAGANHHARAARNQLRRLDGLDWEVVCAQFNFDPHEWLDHIERRPSPNGENGPQFRARVEPCLREIIKRHPGETVGIFCHGGVVRMILSILLELPLPKTNAFEIEYASVTQSRVASALGGN